MKFFSMTTTCESCDEKKETENSISIDIKLDEEMNLFVKHSIRFVE